MQLVPLHTVRKNSDAATDEERSRLEAGLYKLNAVYSLENAWFHQTLSPHEVRNRFQAFAFKCSLCRYVEVVGEYHLGEFVNRFRRGGAVHVESS
jgi:hypothetical protein